MREGQERKDDGCNMTAAKDRAILHIGENMGRYRPSSSVRGVTMAQVVNRKRTCSRKYRGSERELRKSMKRR